MPRNNFTLLLLLLLTVGTSYSQVKTQTDLLKNASLQQAAKEQAAYERLQRLAQEKKWPLVMQGKNGYYAILTGTDLRGNPIYLATDNNIRAAATIRTNRLWPGGSTGLNLNGSSNNVKGKIGIWDGGKVLATHVELTGRINNKNNTANSDHSTHVAGTIMATGVNPLAKGMSYGLQELIAYDFNAHLTEMFAESANLLLSNHSYGEIAGWFFNENANRWEFRGDFLFQEDYKFGYYSQDTQIWDSIAYNAPYYLIVKSAGNNRDVNGPAVGQPYWRYDIDNVMSPAGNRPAGISSNDGYDIISTYGTAKNILTVGAVDPIASGYNKPADVVMSSFSSWGPTDDGRIKPDVVANGVDLLSSIASSNNAYAEFSGTSMATPNASGSLLLLQEYYSKLHSGTFIRSASLKGLVIHTADEAGPTTGPDFKFGWGLVNMEKAAAVITADNDPTIANRKHRIIEGVLANTGTYSLTVVASGTGTLAATLCWTDVKGIVLPGPVLNNNSEKLINDLDIRIKKGATTFLPWTLSNTNRPAAAVPGDNKVDNVEKIEIFDAVPGETYTIEITHKNTLERGQQAYSLIVSGVGGTAYCASAATDAAGGRIDSVSFGATIRKQNPAGCNTYTNYTSLTADIEPNSTVPLFVRVNSCDANTAAKIVKAFIDFNNDGDFADAGELVATSAALASNADYPTNVTIPTGLTVGNYYILRIVAQETANAADVNACGTYLRGETQDYRVRVIPPSNDVSIVEVVNPTSGNCANGAQYVSVRIKNLGATAKTNIPLSGTVMNGPTTVITLTGSYPGTIPGFGEAVYTFQTPFTPAAATTYTINAQTNLVGDQNNSNDLNTATVIIGANTTAPAGQAEICSNQVFFKSTPAAGDVHFWYDSPGATVPIAAGNKTSSTVITGDKNYYLGKNYSNVNIGPATKTTLSTTGIYRLYNAFFITFTNTAPLVIESARLYIGNKNTSGKLQVTVGRNLNFNTSAGSYTYIPVSSTIVDIYATDPTPLPGNQPMDAADQGAVFLLNLTVPTPNNHILIISQPAGDQTGTILANTNLATNPYPAGIPGVFTVTGNVNSYLTSNDPEKFWYFFYDMKIRLANCVSTNRTTVAASTATAPVITLNNNVFTSSKATGNQWHLNNNPIGGANAQTYTATTNGTYKVVVEDDFGCSLTSNEIPFSVTSVPNVDPAEIGLKVLPNPNDGRFFADFTVRKKADLSVSIVNSLGQKVYETIYPGFTGRFNKTIEAGKLSSGVYLLRIQHDNKSYLKKLFVK